jgi:hypothetical protein
MGSGECVAGDHPRHGTEYQVFLRSVFILLRAVRIRAVLVTRIATDVRSGVGLVCDEAEIEARIRLDVDKHAGGP